MIAGGIVAHALEGEVLGHLLDLLLGDLAIQKLGHLCNNLAQLSLHPLVAGEEDVGLMAQLPKVQDMWPAGREVHIAIDEGMHEVRLGSLVAHHSTPVVEVRDGCILGITIHIDDLGPLGPDLPGQHPGGQMGFDQTR